jgi:TonB-linked SusC/RagA family outer membrane protein
VYALPLAAALGLAMPVQAQQTREVTGKVTQQGTGAPLQDAHIGLLGQPIGTRTNDRGEYRLRVPQTDVTIIVRAIGYKRQQRAVPTSMSTADFVLERDVLELEGVTVTGAATTVDKRSAPVAVASVSAAELARVPAPSLESALQGKVVGASINLNNGAPGGGGNVQIRGVTSLIGNVQPLFVVDGVIISNAVRSNQLSVVTGSLNNGEENGTNRLADLNPNDIENIEVLKGAAASAIYGSRATNGVVVITTKKGSTGAPRFDFTGRMGTYQTIRELGSRKFATLADVQNVIGSDPDVQARAAAACNPNCPYFDYVKELYGRTDPSYEGQGSVSGGVNATRYYASGFYKQDAGTAINTGARHQTLRASVDQGIGSRITINVAGNLMRDFAKRGISNNDNALSSPLYAFAYTPSIYNLNSKDETGRYVLNPGESGYKSTSNPFQTFDLMQNNEDVFRMIFSGRAQYNALAWAHNNLDFTLNGGADRYSDENYIVAPQELQFQRQGTVQGGQFPGTVVQGNGTNLFTNVNLTGTWRNSTFGFANFETSGGLQYESRGTNDYNIIGRGLGPQQQNAAGAANTQVTNTRTLVLTQAYFAQEQVQAFNDRLTLLAAVRGERSSVNGDRDQIFYYPRYAAAYRFVSPVKFVDEFKLRTSYGEAGNAAAYGDRDVVYTGSYGLISGLQGYGLPTTAGNPFVKPERSKETEVGFDGVFLNQRVSLEGTYFQRKIEDLLVRPTLAPTSGYTSTTRNGGTMDVKGYEFAATVVPIQTRNFNWTSRNTWYHNTSIIASFPPGVQPFTTGTAAGGFGTAYGRIFYSPGHSVSTIWGNKDVDGKTVRNIPLGDANPRYLMSFGNEFSYKAFSANVLVDYRRGGLLSNMTKNLYDEGGNTWDYDDPSPDPTVGATLGDWRYNSFAGGANTGSYLEDGSYTKVREVSVAWDVPHRLVTHIPSARSARLSLSGRNLFIISPYNGFDPEVNNGGNVLGIRFVDLAPFPPNRSFFLSLSLGF